MIARISRLPRISHGFHVDIPDFTRISGIAGLKAGKSLPKTRRERLQGGPGTVHIIQSASKMGRAPFTSEYVLSEI